MYIQSSGEFPITYKPVPTEADFEHFLQDQSHDLDTLLDEE
jgi:hypothetical protein